MASRTNLVRRTAAVGTAATLALALAACGSSSKGAKTQPATSTVPSASADSSITVPAAIKSKGTITVATDPSYAPNEFFGSDNKTIIGMDVDLANAIGQTLGLKVNAGHGLHYTNVQPIAAIDGIVELNIGHAIVAQAIFTGWDNAVREMKAIMVAARLGARA